MLDPSNGFSHPSPIGNDGGAKLRPEARGIMDAGTFVIAGGSGGIGLELVRLLAPQAAGVEVWSRTPGGLESIAGVRHVACDFTAEGSLPEPPPAVQGAVYCPGSITLRSFRSLTTADFLKDLEVNLLGAVRFLQAIQPSLVGAEGRPASVVLFSTVAVAQGMPMHASIAAAKGGVEGLVRSLAAEWAPKVRVNAIAPALTDTPLAGRLLSSPEKREAMAARYPLKRIGTAADAAALARFLLSDESGWMTGQVLGLDGGLSAVRV
jgi:NAD(P)-dependent dehydrogenase (short-subunit alcohol dehydrogenase family)